MKRWGITAGAVLGASALIVGAFVLLHKSSPIPSNIAKQLTFSAILPAKSGSLIATKIDPSTYKYDPANKLLSFVVTTPSYTMVVSEQNYPDVLIYDKLTNGMNPYDEIATKLGKVTLAHPKSLNGGQAAVVNPSGLLVFAKPSRDLTNDEWTRFFNSLSQ